MQRMKSGARVAVAFDLTPATVCAADSARLALDGFAPETAPERRIASGLRLAEAAETPPACFVTLRGGQGAAARLALLAAPRRAHPEPFGRDAHWLRASPDFVLERRA